MGDSNTLPLQIAYYCGKLSTANDDKIVFPSAPYSKISLPSGSASILINLLMKAGSSTDLLLPARVPLASQLVGHLLLLIRAKKITDFVMQVIQ